MTPLRPIAGRPLLYLALIAVTLLSMWLARRCSTPLPFEPVGRTAAGGDTIDIAIEYAPTSFYRYGDTLGGMAYDMLREISAATGRPMRFHPIVSLAGGVADLRSGLADVVVADLPMTASYDSDLCFTAPVWLDRQVLVQRVGPADSLPAVTSVLDLAGRTVSVGARSPMIVRLENLCSEIGDTIYIVRDSVHSPEQLFMLVALGEVGMAVVNNRLASRMAADYPQVDIATDVSMTQFQSWLLRRDNAEINQWLDSVIDGYKLTPAFDRLMRRYDLEAAGK